MEHDINTCFDKLNFKYQVEDGLNVLCFPVPCSHQFYDE